MPAVRSSAVLWLAILALSSARATAQNATTFGADLTQANNALRAPVSAGGATFTCTPTHCSSKSSPRDPASVCKALKAAVGALKTFTADSKKYDPATCALPVMVSAPTAKATMAPAAVPHAPPPTAPHATVPPARRTVPLPPPAAPPAPAPSSAGKKNAAPAPPPAPAPAPPSPAPSSAGKKSTGAATVLAFTTRPFTLTGTGVAAPRAPFTPMAWSTAAFNVTGTGAAGAAATRPPAGIAFTTDTMRLTGSP